VPPRDPGTSPHRPPHDRWEGAHPETARRAHRRQRRGRQPTDRGADRAAARLRRVARHRAGSGPRRDPRLQGPRAALATRPAPARGAAWRGRGTSLPPADAAGDGADVSRASAAGCGSRSGGIRTPGRRLRDAGESGGRALMELHRLRLVNFRQHADTELEFGPGITGIFGPNGSGKTTLLEAIAWAIYGAQAVRGDKDSIRRLGAKGRAGVQVELDFRLGAHEYRVTRGLSTAALLQDGQVVANSLKSVTDKLERTLGMTHQEFFNTYFTGQKELAVMAALGKTERAAFLSRVLGYERLRDAQEQVRAVRNAVVAEVRGLEAGLPDAAALAEERQTTEAGLARAQATAQAADAARRAAKDALAREEPRWNEWVARRARPGGRARGRSGADGLGARPPIRRDQAHRAPQVVRRGEGAARSHRQARTRGHVPDLQAPARGRVCRGARAARLAARSDHGRRQVLPAAARAAGPAAPEAGGGRGGARPRAGGEPSRQRAGGRAPGAARGGRAGARPADGGAGSGG